MCVERTNAIPETRGRGVVEVLKLAYFLGCDHGFMDGLRALYCAGTGRFLADYRCGRRRRRDGRPGRACEIPGFAVDYIAQAVRGRVSYADGVCNDRRIRR